MAAAVATESTSAERAARRDRRWLQFRLRTLLLVPLLLTLCFRYADNFILMTTGYGAVIGGLWAVGRLWIIGLKREGLARVLPVVSAALFGGLVAGTIAGPLALAVVQRDFAMDEVFYTPLADAAYQVATLMLAGSLIGALSSIAGAGIVGPAFAYLAYAASRGRRWEPEEAGSEVPVPPSAGSRAMRHIFYCLLALVLAVPAGWFAWRAWCHASEAHVIARLRSRDIEVGAPWNLAGPKWIQDRLPVPWFDRVTFVDLRADAMTAEDWDDVAHLHACRRFHVELRQATAADFAQLAESVGRRPDAEWTYSILGVAQRNSERRFRGRIQGFYAPQSLAVINLSGPGIDDTYLAGIPGFRHLSEVLLLDVNVTDAGLKHLAGLPIKQLVLTRSNVAGPGLADLAGIPTLESLSLSETDVTDDDLQYIARIPSLRYLNLIDCNIADAGLKHLTGLPLETLSLDGTSVTDRGADALMKANPGLRVVR